MHNIDCCRAKSHLARTAVAEGQSLYTLQQHLVQDFGFCALIRGLFFFIDQSLSPYLQYFIHLTTAHQKCTVKLLPTSIENCFQQIFNLFQFQCGPSFLFIPWSACWAILHLIGLGLQPYFHKDNDLDLKWFSYLTYWGYTSLALFTAWDCAAAVYVHIRRQDIVKNGEDLQPCGPLF